MKHLILILAAALFAACSTPLVGRVDSDGSLSAKFDGRYLAAKGEGATKLGITDKSGHYIYPAGAPLALGPAAFEKGYDIKLKVEIPYADAMKFLGENAPDLVAPATP